MVELSNPEESVRSATRRMVGRRVGTLVVAERIDEDAAGTTRIGAAGSADGHPEADPSPEGRFLGEEA